MSNGSAMIDRLVYDIQEFLKGNHGHPHFEEEGGVNGPAAQGIITLSKNVAQHTIDLLDNKPRTAYSVADTSIRMSALGEPCLRKMFYSRYYPQSGLPPYAEEPQATLPVKFLLGDYVEEIALFLCEQSGHKVTDRQKEVEIKPTKSNWYAIGHLDAIIDNHVIDVKSAADFAFQKYKREGMVATNDSFGYRYQIDAYATALNTTQRGFLFVNKHDGEMLLLNRTLEPRIDINTRIFTIGRAMEEGLEGKLPERIPAVPDPKLGGALKLTTVCSYCPFKHTCYQGSGFNVTGYISTGKIFYIVHPEGTSENIEKKATIPKPEKAFKV